MYVHIFTSFWWGLLQEVRKKQLLCKQKFIPVEMWNSNIIKSGSCLYQLQSLVKEKPLPFCKFQSRSEVQAIFSPPKEHSSHTTIWETFLAKGPLVRIVMIINALSFCHQSGCDNNCIFQLSPHLEHMWTIYNALSSDWALLCSSSTHLFTLQCMGVS